MVVSIFCAAFRGVAGAVVIALFALTLSACGGGGGGGGGSGSASSTPTTYTISVSVSGLLGSGLQLQLNGGNALNVAANGNVTFSGSLANGSSYSVTVQTQPSSPTQTCTVANATGTIAGGNVANIPVTCSTNTYTVAGLVTGLFGAGLQLALNGNQTLSVAANGSFTFANPLADGSPYTVTVPSQPASPSQTCTVVNGAGSLAGGNVTNITVTCAINTYTVAGSASGLTGTGLQLQLNGGNTLNVTRNGGFVFAGPIADGSSYNVTVRTQPYSPSQTCSVASGAGTVNGANVTTVQVSCTTNSYLVGGTVTGLTGNSVVLQLNGNSLTVTSANRNFTFPAAVASGALYSVTVSTQPAAPAQTCSVTNGSGTMGGTNVNNVIVSCITNISSSSYTIGGSVSGLSGSGLQLQLNGANTKAISGNGAFTFSSSVADTASYSVTVLINPSSPAQTCTVANGTGTVAGANVANVTVSCATTTHTVGGNVSGLLGSGLQLQLNGANDLSVAAPGGAFVFGNAVADGSSYNVTVRTQPSSPSQTCAVTNGTGTASGDVSNVQVNCNTDSFPVSVTVNGLSGGTLTLRNNGGDDLAISGNGSFTFATRVASNTGYAVTVASAPTSPTQTCTVAHGTGVVSNSAVTDVVVNCAINAYTVGGIMTGLSGTGGGLVLRLNGGNALGVSTNGAFTFTDRIADGSAYTVTVATQPSSQTCMVANGTGTLAGAIVTNVTVTCSTVKWSGIKQFGSSADDVANAVAIDPSNGPSNGDVVVVGCYQGAQSGNAKGTCDMPGGNARAYVRKYGSTGDFKWERSLGNSANTQANAVAIDTSGNIYVTGVSQGTLDSQPGHNDDDYFLTKYAPDGTKRWTGVYGGTGADRGNALAFDASGDLYLAGTVYNTSYDIYVAKFTAASLASTSTPPSPPALTATFGSVQAGSAQPNDFAFHVVADRSGSIYVAGTTLGSLNGNANAGGTGDPDTFVIKLNATTFAEQWTRQIGTASYDRNGGVAVDGSGNVYVAGSTGLALPGFTNPTAGVNDLFVVKYDASGVQQWAQQIVSPGHDYATDMAISPGGSLYVAGYTTGNFGGNGNLDPSGKTTDVFLAKYAADGTMLWSRQMGTTTDDRAYAVAADDDAVNPTIDAGAFVAGYTLGALDGNTNAGGADMFVIKYDAAGIRQ